MIVKALAAVRCANPICAASWATRPRLRFADIFPGSRIWGRCAGKCAINGSQSVWNELTEMAADLLVATHALQGLAEPCPSGPIEIGTVQAKGAVRALLGGWDSTLLRALAARPLTLTQLDRLIGAFSYPALERRLSAMRSTGLAESTANRGGTPYTVTPWTRQGIGPIIAAALFERLHLADVPPPTRSTSRRHFFSLRRSRSCPQRQMASAAWPPRRVTAVADNGRHAGVEVTVDRGRVECVSPASTQPPQLGNGPDHRLAGALVHGRPEQLHIGGDRRLALSLIQGMHEQLFAPLRQCA